MAEGAAELRYLERPAGLETVETVRLLIATLVAYVGLLAPTAVAAGPSTIAVLHGATTVQYYGGVEVWSDYESTDRSWQVAVRRNGRISIPSIPTAGKAIEVDVGPGPSGTPMLAYISCAGACHVVVSEVDGSDPQMVPGSDGASHPTIWGNQVAWVAGKTKVIASHLDGTERRLLTGAPARKCYHPGTDSTGTPRRIVCRAPEKPRVEALQLYREQLALIDSFRLQDEYEGHVEVRTESITGGPRHLIAILGIGIASETYIGPSWSEGKLYFYEDTNGAGFKIYRYNPARNAYATTDAYAYLTGFSVIGDRAYEATALENPSAIAQCATDEGNQCVLRFSEPFAFKPTRAPVYVP